MNILKALGMLAVIGGHSGINFLPWFPVYSFHMPLFMFISGYFFHDKPFLTFLRKTGKRLLLPFLLWNFFFGAICTVLLKTGVIAFGTELSLCSFLIEPFISGHQFIFNLATWFVGALIIVQGVYWLLYRLCKKNMFFLTVVSFIAYFISLYLAFHHYYPNDGNVWLVIERTCFGLCFYHLGLLYKLYIERRDTFSILRIFTITCLNGILLGFVSQNISFVMVFMNFPSHAILLPLITSLTGIYLYMQIAELLKDKIPRDSLLGFVGENTFSFMALHSFFFWMLNTTFLWMKQLQIFPLRSFDYDRYMHDIYYRITEHAPMNDALYFLAGLIGSGICIYVWKRYIDKRIMAIANRIL
ncbi:acyltransferase family protein [uncultured Veillonella sp.]|uniref:acyltransferase family protein n=1 Tax=uncultured Veillonella sp. TaxID=159268 RepID=UPI0025922A07|nr:acyltransferase family protein [uncultured Veillonella sp.]